MEAILTTFGIDWRLLLINAINFGLLLFGLWYFLYGPVMRMLDERRTKVAQGVADAQKAADELRGIEDSRAAALAQAGKEADNLVSQARASAAQKEREIVAQGEAAAARIVKEAEAQAQEAKAQAIAESKEEVARMIVLGMEKTLTGKSA
ncbi:MAG TPA: F0F1 ATP synthase subunit B [Candidatus Paceibacterota bacterium]|nr:F0F1 ATP synthase subunit B [Candidatus Paceibacterota bacterium]